MKTCAKILLLCLFMASIAAPSVDAKRRERGKPMADIPDNVGMWLYLRAYYDPIGDESEIDLPVDAGYIKIGYNPVTNRIKIFEATSDRREVPTFSTQYQAIATDAIVLVNFDGDFDTTLTETLPNPLFTFAGNVMGVVWPDMSQTHATADHPRWGDSFQTWGETDELARDGITAVHKARLGMGPVEQIPRFGEALEWSTNTAPTVDIWENISDRSFIPTKFILRYSDTDFTGFTDTISIGANTPAADNITGPFRVDAITSNDDCMVVPVRSDKFQLIRPGNFMYMLNSGTTPGHFFMEIWGYYID